MSIVWTKNIFLSKKMPHTKSVGISVWHIFLVRVPKLKLVLRSLYSSGKLKLDFQKPSLISSIRRAVLGTIAVSHGTVPKGANTIGVVLQCELPLQVFVVSAHPIAEGELFPVLKNQDPSFHKRTLAEQHAGTQKLRNFLPKAFFLYFEARKMPRIPHGIQCPHDFCLLSFVFLSHFYIYPLYYNVTHSWGTHINIIHHFPDICKFICLFCNFIFCFFRLFRLFFNFYNCLWNFFCWFCYFCTYSIYCTNLFIFLLITFFLFTS